MDVLLSLAMQQTERRVEYGRLKNTLPKKKSTERSFISISLYLLESEKMEINLL